jgi:hypothetical protein
MKYTTTRQHIYGYKIPIIPCLAARCICVWVNQIHPPLIRLSQSRLCVDLIFMFVCCCLSYHGREGANKEGIAHRNKREFGCCLLTADSHKKKMSLVADCWQYNRWFMEFFFLRIHLPVLKKIISQRRILSHWRNRESFPRKHNCRTTQWNFILYSKELLNRL